jgi:hypothetical protein
MCVLLLPPPSGSIKIVYDPQPTPKAIAALLGTKIKQVGGGPGGGVNSWS